MNLLICFEILVFTLAAPVIGFAATVGDTADVKTLHGRGVFSLKENQNISVKASFDLDVIIDRKLRAGDATKLKFEPGEWGMLRFGYRMFDRVEPYFRLGWAHLKAGWRDSYSGKEVKLTTRSGLAWGVGVKALIYEFETPNIKIIGDGSYRTADLDPAIGYVNGSKSAITRSSSKFVIREWQAALLAATEIDLRQMFDQTDLMNGYKVSPYLGMVYSAVSGRLRMVTGDGSVYHPDGIEADKNIGLVVGCDVILPGDYSSLNLEGRFIDETAVSGGLALLF